MKYIYEVVIQSPRQRIETFTRYQELRAVDMNRFLVEVYSGRFPTNLITTLKTADEIESWVEGQERAEVWLRSPAKEPNLDKWDPFKDTDIQLTHTDASVLAKDHLPYITNQIEEALTNLVVAFKLLKGKTPSKAVIRTWLRDDTL